MSDLVEILHSDVFQAYDHSYYDTLNMTTSSPQDNCDKTCYLSLSLSVSLSLSCTSCALTCSIYYILFLKETRFQYCMKYKRSYVDTGFFLPTRAPFIAHAHACTRTCICIILNLTRIITIYVH